MLYSPENAAVILQLVNDTLKMDASAPDRLNKLWSVLQFSRARLLTNGLRQIVGDKVQAGPFKGMVLTEEALHFYQAPYLLGTYEQELHPALEKVIETDYDCVLNIGCSVGYYAVGLARRMPNTLIEAFDIDRDACLRCADMARVNGVADRVRISGVFRGDDFAQYADRKTLVLIDVEGVENELLNPILYPALQKMDVIVELHDVIDPLMSKRICGRFADSHAVQLVPNHAFLADVGGLVPPETQLDALDLLLLAWEGRDGPTPWGLFWKHQ